MVARPNGRAAKQLCDQTVARQTVVSRPMVETVARKWSRSQTVTAKWPTVARSCGRLDASPFASALHLAVAFRPGEVGPTRPTCLLRCKSVVSEPNCVFFIACFYHLGCAWEGW